MLTSLAAYVFVSLIAVVVLFQLALSAGAPWGATAMGGRFPGIFPTPMRIAALLQALILTLLGLIVPIHARLFLPDFYSISEVGIWVVVVVFSLSLIMNLATPSKWERIIWAPVVAILVVCALLVAIL
jgi:hypothetical protein